MVRICVTVADAGMAANVGGPVQVTMRTFDVENAELESLLLITEINTYVQAHVSGAEVITGKPTEQ